MRRYAQISGLGVHGSAVIGGPCPLAVGQERLADVAERHFLEIAERLDRRVCALAAPRPGAQQGCQDGDAGMQIGHAVRVRNSARAVAGCPLT